MNIHIRNSRPDEYSAIEKIMKQVQQMHIDWRPDIYKYSETVLPFEIYKQAVEAGTFLLRNMRVVWQGFYLSHTTT